MMKRVYQFVLVCCLLSCLLCGPALADSTTTASTNGIGREEVTNPARTEFVWGGGEAGENGAGRGYATFGSIMSTIFGGVWAIMGNEMPLIGLTFQQFFLGMLAVNVGLWILRKMGVGGEAVGSRSSSTNRPRVSAKRKDDEY